MMLFQLFIRRSSKKSCGISSATQNVPEQSGFETISDRQDSSYKPGDFVEVNYAIGRPEFYHLGMPVHKQLKTKWWGSRRPKVTRVQVRHGSKSSTAADTNSLPLNPRTSM